MESHSTGPPAPTPPATQTVNENPEKRKRQPRNSACSQCAALKMKCVASGDGSGKCERCNRMGRECVPAVPKPRKRRAESGVGIESPTGVPLSNIVDSEATPGASITPKAKAIANRTTTFATRVPADSLRSRPDIRHNGSKSFATLFAQGLSCGELPPGIDYNYVQNSFTIFRQYATHLPFVSSLPGSDAVNMIAQRPMTTAAICTVTASANVARQEHFSQVFRRSLSTKSIVEGERSIDLMIGLLIFLNWHHHYMSKPQIYQNLCLLAGMAVDLGIYRQTPQTNIEDVSLAIERDRAFLGCYYICATLSTKGLNRPTPLRWTDSFRGYAESVARSGNMASDRSLVPLIELAHALEELEAGMQSGVDLKRSTVACLVEMHAKAANHSLKTLKREHPSLNSHSVFAAATIDVHHKLLAAGDTTDTSTLIQCAVAIKEYIDDLLARPPIILHHMTIVDWTDLLQVLVLMAKVSKPVPNNSGWEAGALTSMLQPDAILDSIYAHMASAPTADLLAPRHEALLHAFGTFSEFVKRNIVHDSTSAARAQSQSNAVKDSGHSLAELRLPYDANIAFASFGSPLDEGVLEVFMRGR